MAKNQRVPAPFRNGKKGAEPAADAPTSPKVLCMRIEGDPEKYANSFTVSGLGTGAMISSTWSELTFRDATFNGTLEAILRFTEQVSNNDFRQAETMLVSQAVALNALFGELTRRAGLNIGEHFDATERYLRLAMKAQSQCRTTLETLANIKNPPVVFAKQANVSNGPQQVNNVGAVSVEKKENQNALPHARGEILDFESNKLLEPRAVNGTVN